MATVTDEEVRAYYDQNRDDFDRPPVAYTSYVTIPRLTNTADTAAAEARVRALKDEIERSAIGGSQRPRRDAG